MAPAPAHPWALPGAAPDHRPGAAQAGAKGVAFHSQVFHDRGSAEIIQKYKAPHNDGAPAAGAPRCSVAPHYGHQVLTYTPASRDTMTKNVVLKGLLIVAGSLSLALGVLGIFLPLLPTTPFLLLAAACYVRSSEALYRRLLANRYLGPYIRSYREGRGLPLGAKVATIALLWVVISLSAAFATGSWVLRGVLLLIAAGVTTYLLTLPTLRRQG